jgi:uncharacterized membrane protein YjgN (DUF898 family)
MQENRIWDDISLRELYALWLVNLLLNIITLGIYSFWGKTRLRHYLVQSCYMNNDRFEYRGQGGELFRGFLKALPILIALNVPFIIWNPETYPEVNLLIFVFFPLFYMALYSAQRYRLSRTHWRGIRGRLMGSAVKYGFIKSGWVLLNIITLGIMSPITTMQAQAYMMRNMRFGNAPVSFEPNPSSLMGSHITTALLFIPTLGMSRQWYHAKYLRHVYKSTRIGSLRLHGTQTGGSLLMLKSGNLCILLLTLGLGLPIVMKRSLRYFLQNLVILGNINTSEVMQSDEKLGHSGEGLDEALGDHDYGIF